MKLSASDKNDEKYNLAPANFATVLILMVWRRHAVRKSKEYKKKRVLGN